MPPRVPCSCLLTPLLAVPALHAPAGKQGRPSTLARVEDHAYLTRDEVDELQEVGGGAALKAAFTWLYGRPTASGNMAWVRKSLMGGDV